MTSLDDWSQLSHQEKMELFGELNDEEVIQRYLPEELSPDDFRRQLHFERRFWRPENAEEVRIKEGTPTKATTIGAWRDLSRAEAILELIDNSIDAWMRRRRLYPRRTAKHLLIFIDIDARSRTLTYEDNAGGVEEDILANLVGPGRSETVDTDRTIGSYRTGGKKAIFKLASDANIRTRYWNPVETGDDIAYEIHLDRKWLTDPTEYDFPYYPLKDKTVLQKGQTVYTFRLHEATAGWDVRVVDGITAEIRRNYTLLMLRNPEIEIYFMDRTKPLEPLADMYRFSGVYDKERGLDLRPQRVFFKTQLDLKGEEHDITIEIGLGCRTTTAARRGEDGFGIDLYGNDRLFIHQGYEPFRDWYDLPKGGARNFVRGYINIIGPNALIPWDTHKRHLNPEREVLVRLRNHPYVKQLFHRWRQVYLQLARSPEIKRTISERVEPWSKGRDLNIPFSNTLDLPKRRRRVSLPQKVHIPSVPEPRSVEEVAIRLKLSSAEFKLLCEEYSIDSEERGAKSQLAKAIYETLLSEIS